MLTPTRNVYIQNTLCIQVPKKDQLFQQQEKDRHFRRLLFKDPDSVVTWTNRKHKNNFLSKKEICATK